MLRSVFSVIVSEFSMYRSTKDTNSLFPNPRPTSPISYECYICEGSERLSLSEDSQGIGDLSHDRKPCQPLQGMCEVPRRFLVASKRPDFFDALPRVWQQVQRKRRNA